MHRYEEYDERPSLERAADSFFSAADESGDGMVLKGWPTTSPPQGVIDVDAEGEVAIRKHGIWAEVLVELEDPETTSHTVDCRMVGIPRLLAKPKASELRIGSMLAELCGCAKRTALRLSLLSSPSPCLPSAFMPDDIRASPFLPHAHSPPPSQVQTTRPTRARPRRRRSSTPRITISSRRSSRRRRAPTRA